ncbi:MAG: glycosyltransferase [Chloroflexota bacterium]
MAVLSVHTSPLARLGSRDAGGMNVIIRRLAEQLGSMGAGVDVFTRRSESHGPSVVGFARNARLIQVKAGPVRYVAKQKLEEYLPQFVTGVKRFADAESRGYDLVHSHYYLSGWAGSVIAHCWRVPHVQSFHTLARVKDAVLPHAASAEAERRAAIEAHVMATADRVIAASATERQEMLDFYGAAPGKVTVIPHGLDLTLFRPGDRIAAKQRLGVSGRPVLLFVGRMDRIKGVETLLRATCELVRKQPGCELRLLIVGGDRQVRVLDDAARELLRLRALVAELGLRDTVKFIGPREQAELPVHYAAADVCVVPSYTESFGMVALEAMACGTPVVAANVGGLRSTVVHGETGFLVQGRDPARFAEHIAELLASPELRARLGRNGVERARRYQWPVVARQLHATYLSLISSPALASAVS